MGKTPQLMVAAIFCARRNARNIHPPHFLQLLRKKHCRVISLAASGDNEKDIINAEIHYMLHRNFCFHLAFKFFNSGFGQMICSYLN